MRSSGIEPTPLVLTSSDMLLFFASFDFCLSMAENKVNGQKSAIFLFPFFFLFFILIKRQHSFCHDSQKKIRGNCQGPKGLKICGLLILNLNILFFHIYNMKSNLFYYIKFKYLKIKKKTNLKILLLMSVFYHHC